MTAPATDQPMVYVVDDDEPVRDAIGLLLDTVDLPHLGFEDAQSFLGAYHEGMRGALVLDIRMPGMNGLELQQALAERSSTLPIIFITGHGDIPMAVDAMRRGALDFIRKPFRDQELLDRVNEALQVEERSRSESELRGKVAERQTRLTPRELEVFDRVAAGQANKVIAIELSISERTVEIHRSQVMRKMEAKTLADLVRMKIVTEASPASG